MSLKYHLRNFFQKAGYDVTRFPPPSHPMERRKRMLAEYGIDMVLDVGANRGQFAQQLRREAGYGGRIVSFEPLSEAFTMLQANAQGDAAWQIYHHALGDATEETEINIAGNSYSSSLLAMMPAHQESAPHSQYVGKERIQVKTLDSLFAEVCGAARNIYLKLDTQGFEGRVLKGAEKSLARINTVEMEMSLVPLYEGELLFPEMCGLMRGKGYALMAIDEEFTDPRSGQVLQVNGIFRRQQV
jgi:FkbM family methyltransferase